MPSSKDIRIKKSDIEIEFYRSSGPGGQHKNKTSTAVRIRHIPTGIVAQASASRVGYAHHKNIGKTKNSPYRQVGRID